jgi:hypothetical protein
VVVVLLVVVGALGAWAEDPGRVASALLLAGLLASSDLVACKPVRWVLVQQHGYIWHTDGHTSSQHRLPSTVSLIQHSNYSHLYLAKGEQDTQSKDGPSHQHWC